MSASETPAERALRITLEDVSGTGARIKVIGVGGGGNNAVDRMALAGLGGGTVDLIVANTDQQALEQNNAPIRLQIGAKLTNGLGAGADPEIGEKAALEDTEQLLSALAGADMVFITAGLGGGTGTGAAPIVTSLASELGALTVAAVTMPFTFEGRIRARHAQQGLARVQAAADSVITIPNDRLLGTIDRKMPLTQAFEVVDDVLVQAIRGIADLVIVPGLINLDFADLKTTMSGKGPAIMGTGTGTGESRAVDAATRAVSSPLLERAGLEGARSVIVNVTGGQDLSMIEVSEATSTVQEAAHEDANIIFGAVVDHAMEDTVKITVIATEFAEAEAARAEPAAVAVAASAAPTPNDLNAYVARQDQEAEEAERAVAVAAAASSEGVGEMSETEVASVEVSDHPVAASMEESAADRAIAKARALSNFSMARRPAFELPIAPEAEAAESDEPAADLDLDLDVGEEGTDRVDDHLPAFLRSAGK